MNAFYASWLNRRIDSLDRCSEVCILGEMQPWLKGECLPADNGLHEQFGTGTLRHTALVDQISDSMPRTCTWPRGWSSMAGCSYMYPICSYVPPPILVATIMDCFSTLQTTMHN